MMIAWVRRGAMTVAGLLLFAGAAQAEDFTSPEKLGEALFNDVNLSKNRTQACASCHSPAFAFTDPREDKAGHAVSLGDDGHSLGDRNAPTAAYARFSPAFGPSQTKPGVYVGGQFLDGRAASLEEQAGGPPLNPLEMGMAKKADVVARIQENADYVAAMERLYGKDVFTSSDKAYGAMEKAVAAFERTPEFAPFDSKYDRYLRGEEKLTDQEELGRVLFFSRQFTNCALCHKLNVQGGTAGETFSNYEFHNIGVPANPALAKAGAVKPDYVDTGLARNPAITDPAQAGKFKVPSLRNVAVTGPYMHNGVFKDLRTVILFYNTYNTKNPMRKINPETGEPFAPPEVPQNISQADLEVGPALDNRRMDALVAFLETLTDRRYEPLLAEKKAERKAQAQKVETQ